MTQKKEKKKKGKIEKSSLIELKIEKDLKRREIDRYLDRYLKTMLHIFVDQRSVTELGPILGCSLQAAPKAVAVAVLLFQ